VADFVLVANNEPLKIDIVDTLKSGSVYDANTQGGTAFP